MFCDIRIVCDARSAEGGFFAFSENVIGDNLGALKFFPINRKIIF